MTDGRGVTERELIQRLRAAGLDPGAWSNGPGDRYAVHDHAYDKVIVVTAGSIRFGIPEIGTAIDLSIGDRLDLPAGSRHDAVVGPSGVACLEAHAPSGTLGHVPERRAAGTWT